MEVPELTGTSVVLRRLRPSDRDDRQALGWHADIERNYGVATGDGPMTDAEAEDWYSGLAAAEVDADSCFWLIASDDELAGYVTLFAIRRDERRARLAVGMFHPRFRGRGLGTEAMLLVLHHGFGALGLHRVDLRVLDFNEQAIAAYERCGFVVEGRERETCWLDGRWHDDLVMAVLEDEVAPLSVRRQA